jgi:hypothetical protein
MTLEACRATASPAAVGHSLVDVFSKSYVPCCASRSLICRLIADGATLSLRAAARTAAHDLVEIHHPICVLFTLYVIALYGPMICIYILSFQDVRGTIEVEVAGSPLPDAPPGARGFVGVVFRVQAADESFGSDGIYLRPTNGRADDQVRRNHSTQYFAYPGYDFARLRREAPAQYESYVDLIPGEWTTMRIEVQGTTAKLFVGGAPQPTLIVNDLKRGADAHGSVGLYVDNGTDGHFRNLRVRLTS